MKYSFLVLTLASSLSFAAAPASDWKVISETQDCPVKIQIKAKAGEKYVIAVDGKKEHKLIASNGTGFDPNSMNATEYKTEEKSGTNYSFIQPSYVENRPAKLMFAQNGKSDRCPLIAK